MDYQNRSDLEDLTVSYLDAVERQDRAALEKLWTGSESDRMISIYGYCETVPRILDEYQEVFESRGVKALSILDSTFEIQRLDEQEALLTLFYKVAVAEKSGKSAQPWQINETLFCTRQNGTWKIRYSHQSLQEHLPDSKYQQRQSERLARMIEMLAEEQGRTVSMPRSLRERLELYNSLLMSWRGENPSAEYLSIEEETFGEASRRVTYTLPESIMSDDQQTAAWKGPVNGFMADSFITFNVPQAETDALLTPYTGIMLQVDNAMLWKKQDLQDGFLVHTEPGWYLPCRTIQEVFLKPVYGLYTRQDQETFARAFEQALDQAAQSEARSVLITSRWRDLLHIPSRMGMDQMLEAVQKRLDDPDCSISQVIFMADRKDTYRRIRNKTGLWQRTLARSREEKSAENGSV